MKRLALVFPRFKYPSGDPPLGVGYLASAALAWTDWEVDVIDTTFFRDPAAQMEERIARGAYDMVGISFMTTMIRGASLAAAAAKRRNPRTLVVAGGPHPTVAPASVLADVNFDMVAAGEGEVTLTELLRQNGDPAGIPGLIYRKGGEIVREKPRTPVEDLDSLPTPAFERFDMESYFKSWFLLDTVAKGLKGTSLMGSRGCPYQCTYCQPTLEALFGKKIRRRSPGNIVRELKGLKEKYGLSAFTLQDDTFLIDRKWVLAVGKALEESGLGFLFECNLRANLVDAQVLSALKRAGLRKVNLGIESANQRILDDIFQKGITFQQVQQAVSTCRDLGLKIMGYFMLGAPSETLEEVLNTVSKAARLDLDEATFTLTTPLPHTFLYDRTKDKIEKEFEDFDYYSSSVYKPGTALRPGLLFWLKRWAFLRFYLDPKRIWNTFKMTLDFRNFSKTLARLKRL
jgi:anaerobic magnesium-protoporphyrin IX monomethyl ester cyclase